MKLAAQLDTSQGVNHYARSVSQSVTQGEARQPSDAAERVIAGGLIDMSGT